MWRKPRRGGDGGLVSSLPGFTSDVSELSRKNECSEHHVWVRTGAKPRSLWPPPPRSAFPPAWLCSRPRLTHFQLCQLGSGSWMAGARRGASVASSLSRQNTNLRALAASGRGSSLKSRRLAAHFEPRGYFFFIPTNLP